MDRRGFLAGSAALAAALAGPAFGADVDDLRAAAREAWLYGLPLVELARLRAREIGARPTPGTPGFNAFAHRRDPVAVGDAALSAPEVDVLYSSAWIDLAASPAKIYAPPSGGRYMSLTVLDLYGNVLAAIDNADTGLRGRELTFVGPPSRVAVAGYTAPMPRLPTIGPAIRAPGNWIWALARTQFVGAADLARARALQDELEVRVKSRPAAPAPSAALDAPWGDYFFAVQQLIDETPPPAAEANFFRRLAALQLGASGGFERARFADPDLGGIVAGVAEARILASQCRADDGATSGWAYPKRDFGDYGMDFLYRAREVLSAPGAPPPARVMTLRAIGPDGSLTFPSAGWYQLTLPEPPPADAFWSLTLYKATPEGRLVLPDTPRHALSDKVAELKRRDDGGVDVWIGRTDPGGARSSNWLPTPPGHGQFALLLRAYAPGAALTERRYHAGTVVMLGAGPAPRPRARPDLAQ